MPPRAGQRVRYLDKELTYDTDTTFLHAPVVGVGQTCLLLMVHSPEWNLDYVVVLEHKCLRPAPVQQRLQTHQVRFIRPGPGFARAFKGSDVGEKQVVPADKDVLEDAMIGSIPRGIAFKRIAVIGAGPQKG